MLFSSLPNLLSILRIILAVPIVLTLLNQQYFLTLILFFIAGVTDVLDGWIAKRFNWQTQFGSILDPVADKILLITSFSTLFFINLLPFWLLILIFSRDLMIVSGAIGWFLAADNEKNLSPTKLSKFNTVLQIMLVLLLIASQLQPILKQWVLVFFVVVATSTTLSGADYIWVWSEKIISQTKIKR